MIFYMCLLAKHDIENIGEQYIRVGDPSEGKPKTPRIVQLTVGSACYLHGGTCEKTPEPRRPGVR